MLVWLRRDLRDNAVTRVLTAIGGAGTMLGRYADILATTRVAAALLQLLASNAYPVPSTAFYTAFPTEYRG